MSMKRLAVMAFMAAIISTPAAYAAGPAGFARGLAASPAVGIQVAEAAKERKNARVLDRSSAKELLRVNRAVNKTIDSLDSYLDGFTTGFASAAASRGCTDCADIKRDRLLALGWRKDMMRIAYAVSDRGRIQRVLVVRTDRGEVLLGERVTFVRSRHQQAGLAAEAFPRHLSKAASYYDI